MSRSRLAIDMNILIREFENRLWIFDHSHLTSPTEGEEPKIPLPRWEGPGEGEKFKRFSQTCLSATRLKIMIGFLIVLVLPMVMSSCATSSLNPKILYPEQSAYYVVEYFLPFPAIVYSYIEELNGQRVTLQDWTFYKPGKHSFPVSKKLKGILHIEAWGVDVVQIKVHGYYPRGMTSDRFGRLYSTDANYLEMVENIGGIWGVPKIILKGKFWVSKSFDFYQRPLGGAISDKGDLFVICPHHLIKAEGISVFKVISNRTSKSRQVKVKTKYSDQKLNQASGIEIYKDRVYVTDLDTVKIFDFELRLVDIWQFPNRTLKDLRIRNGKLFLSDSAQGKILICDLITRKVSQEIDNPHSSYLALYEDKIYAIGEEGVNVFTSDGVFLRTYPFIDIESGIGGLEVVDGNVCLYVIGYTSRIVIYRDTQKKLSHSLFLE